MIERTVLSTGMVIKLSESEDTSSCGIIVRVENVLIIHFNIYICISFKFHCHGSNTVDTELMCGFSLLACSISPLLRTLKRP